MSTRTDREQAHVQASPRQLRDGILLIILGLAVGYWLVHAGPAAASSLGFVIAFWGLVLVGNALWVRSRRPG